MTVSVFVFLMFSVVISIVDYRKQIIPDKIVLPAIFILLFVKYLEHSLCYLDLVAGAIVVLIFLIPILLNLSFGGGDLRFGFFCAVFVGLQGIGYFIVLSALLHIVFLKITKKKILGFAPAMSLGAILVYGGLNFL